MKRPLLIFAFSRISICHSWVEQVARMSNEELTGNIGYARGNVLRTSKEFLQSGDSTMTYLLPPDGRTQNYVLQKDPICKNTQQPYNVTTDSPMLEAGLGDRVALRYQENGHITMPVKSSTGTVSVYGTNDTRVNDTFLSIHDVWSRDGHGGDQRGILLSRSSFDDGSCYQINNEPLSAYRQSVDHDKHDSSEGQNLWCMNTVNLPSYLSTGSIYSLYWVWDWPTIGSEFHQEYYTTCIDIQIS